MSAPVSTPTDWIKPGVMALVLHQSRFGENTVNGPFEIAKVGKRDVKLIGSPYVFNIQKPDRRGDAAIRERAGRSYGLPSLLVPVGDPRALKAADRKRLADAVNAIDAATVRFLRQKKTTENALGILSATNAWLGVMSDIEADEIRAEKESTP
jgi:hypothetical protein